MWSTVFLLHFLHSFHKCILHISILSMSLCFIDRLGLCPVPASGLGVYVKYALLSRSVKCSWVIGLGPFHHDSSVSQTEATPFASLLNEKMGKAEPSQLIATHSPYISWKIKVAAMSPIKTGTLLQQKLTSPHPHFPICRVGSGPRCSDFPGPCP